MRSLLVAIVALLPALAVAQSDAEPRVIVVPYPGEPLPADAGVAASAPDVAPAPTQSPPPAPEPVPAPAPAQTELKANQVPDAPTSEPSPSLEPPLQPLPPGADPEAGKPVSAMLDGHPREGSFLAGPGSLAFVLHHTLMGLVAGLGTQLAPRILNTTLYADMHPGLSATDQDARLAYLAAGLIGAGVGFASSATWQFFHWIDTPAATFGIVNSLFGSMFGLGLINFFSTDPVPIAWGSAVGALAGAWLTTIIGGGQLPLNKGLLMTSGAGWAALYVACGVAIAATTGGGGNVRMGVDAILIAPAIGAGLMALALLKFNPSTAQILRADIFGAGAGAAVLLISALVLGANFAHPVPYILAGVASAGAITTVSLLWADTAEPNTGGNSASSASLFDPEAHKGARRTWW